MAIPLFWALHAAQAALSGYGLYISYFSATNLMQYEDKAERASKWSNTAEYRLHKTRTTQAAAVGALLLSLLATTPSVFVSSVPSATKLGLNVGVAAAMVAARQYILNFWGSKARMPGVTAYNEGMKQTEGISRILGYLAGAWALTSLGGAAYLFAS